MNLFSLAGGFLSLRRNADKSRRAIAALQEKKLRRLLTYACTHSDYYRERFKAAGITAEKAATAPLSSFPTMDKQALITHFDALVTDKDLTQAALRRFDSEESKDKRFLQKYHVVHSSGSTGVPSYFVYDEAAWQTMLLGILRGALWGMTLPEIIRLLLGRPRILYIAATGGRYGGAMAVGDGIKGVGAHQLFLDVNTPLTEWKQKIEAFKPNMVIGYPSAMMILAGLAQAGETRLDLLRVISCGEPLAPGMRKHLETTLNTQVVNFYGASESLALGAEGALERDMTLFDDLNVIEVVDGEMYLTCLYNFTQPLIRYHLSDKLTLREGGGAFSHADILLGRNEDMLWFENGQGQRDFLHPLSVEGFCLDGLTDYQFVQRGNGDLTMLAVADRAQQESIRLDMQRQMDNLLAEKHLDWVRFEMRFVSEILPDPATGKKRLIVRDEKRPLNTESAENEK